MKLRTSRALRRGFLLAGASLAAAAPVTVDGDGLGARTVACQDGTCCPEEKSTCVVGGTANPGYFYQRAGSCQIQDT